MEPTPRDAFVSLWTIKHTSEAARRYSADNGIILLVWSAVIFVSLICFDLFPAIIAAYILSIASATTAVWQAFYKRRLPVQPARLKLNRVVLVWTFYHVCLISGGTVGIWLLFHRQFPFMFTAIALLDAVPFLFIGMRTRQQLQAYEQTRSLLKG